MNSLRHLILRVCASLRWLPPTVTRLTLGWVFVESGWGKLHNLPKVIDFFRSLGIPAPEIQARFSSSMELLCGVLILLGLCTRLASLPLIVIMTVAILTARRSELNGISDLFGFIEYLYIAMALWLAAYGAGPISLDALIAKRMDRDEAPATIRSAAR
jgi:putative oxidoreductase